MPLLHRDYETRSTLDLECVGAARYAADPSTGVWCAGYVVDDGQVQLWWPDQPIPEAFFEAARNPTWLIVAHNDAFDRLIEEHILAPRYGWPLVPIERHRGTMAMALACGLPGALERVADALELEHRKDAEGSRLMKQMASRASRVVVKTRAAFIGMMTLRKSRDSANTANATLRSSANCMGACRL